MNNDEHVSTLVLLSICSVLVLLGVLLHFVTKLSELEQRGQLMSAKQYWTEHPWTSLQVILYAYAAIGIEWATGELTYAAAILTGIACNSLGDKLRASAEARVNDMLGIKNVTLQIPATEASAAEIKPKE